MSNCDFSECFGSFRILQEFSFEKTAKNLLFIGMTAADLIRSVFASPLFITKEIMHQKKLEPSCLVVVAYLNSGLFLPGEMILSAMNCERFIGIKFPIWHRVHITQSRLIKVGVASYVVGCTVTVARSITGKGTNSHVFVLYLCSCVLVGFRGSDLAGN